MGQARKPMRMRPKARSLGECLRDFLTPEVWKQARNAGKPRKMPRWDLHPLLLVLLTMTWTCGDSLPERFEAARGFYVFCHEKKKRPGETFQGFQQALEKLAMPVLRTVAAGIRRQLEKRLAKRLMVEGFIPLGCDGTRCECPRTEELETRLGVFGKEHSAPMLWITALVHLPTGVPWSWRFGCGGKASERKHLCLLLSCLPKLAMVVTDAGYYGYEVIHALIAAKTCFLIRMCSNVKLFVENLGDLREFQDGEVWYWPESVQNKGGKPLRLRLIRIAGKTPGQDVWLLTNVLDSEKFSRQTAARFYRWRWENEGYFRTYKRTLGKVKFLSRSVRSLHREAEATMIATQLLLAQGALAMPEAAAGEETSVCSPRQVLLEIRRAMQGGLPAGKRRRFSERLRHCRRERRVRKSPKQKREWPRRKPHKSPGPPQILPLNDAQKTLLDKLLSENYNANC
jgi:hypothetical protein